MKYVIILYAVFLLFLHFVSTLAESTINYPLYNTEVWYDISLMLNELILNECPAVNQIHVYINVYRCRIDR